ncbi:MAG: AbrB/MazE/SpoVT family DNA-binding domain-containing protein [Bacteroidales bacterium]|nr:AbrB/MazE/SpoVT family DNA-binding domain-containing protein [Bacteroidales bacterium]
MTTRLIKIGNSRGILIPSSILKKLSLKEKDELMIQIQDGRIVLTVVTPEFTGPFTGPFAELARFAPDEEDTRDALEIARELHDSRVNTRDIPTL